MRLTPNLKILNLGDNRLSQLTLPIGVRHLEQLTLSMNAIREFQKPRDMKIHQIFGLSTRQRSEYDVGPIIRSHRLLPGEGFMLEILSTDGLLEIETSSDLATWSNHGKVRVNEWNGTYFIQNGPIEDKLFFRAVRPGGGD